MVIYQNILVAIELNHVHDNAVLKRALELANNQPVHLHLVHAIEPIAPLTTESAFFEISDIENQINEEHQEAIFKLAANYKINESHVYVVTGSANHSIPELAKQKNVDLIIVGNHEKSGLASLIGSTAKSLLNHPFCDVLAVRVPE